MDVRTIGMIAGAFLVGTLVPYAVKRIQKMRKKRRVRYRRPIRRHVHQYFPENPDE